MKILYISSPSFFDMDLSLIKSLSNINEVIYLLDLPPHSTKSTALSLQNQIKISQIMEASNYNEFDLFRNYINIEKSFVINRISNKAYSISNLILQFKIYNFVNTIKPDIIHCNNFLNLNFFYFLFKNTIPIVLTIHDPFPHSGEQSKKKHFIRTINYRFIKSKLLLSSSQLNKYILVNNFRPQDVYTTSLGTYDYINDFVTSPKVVEKNSILFFGRISPYKGLKYLIDAVELLVKDKYNIKLTIAGAGLFNFLDQSLIKDYIRIINRYITCEELADLISKSEIIVCPYIDATQSGVIMTAFAMNKPVIATKVGNFEEIVKDQLTGILVAPKSDIELANAIISLITNPTKLQEFERNINTEYKSSGLKSWSNISYQLNSIYYKILNQKRIK